MDNELRESFRFHLKTCAYSTPPGNAVCAFNLAKAEMRLLASKTHRIKWVNDEDYDISWAEDDEQYLKALVSDLNNGRLVSMGIIVEKMCPHCHAWDQVDSLWGIIIEPTDEQRRPYEAQMALENLTEIMGGE